MHAFLLNIPIHQNTHIVFQVSLKTLGQVRGKTLCPNPKRMHTLFTMGTNKAKE
jgi:hypothetical protein